MLTESARILARRWLWAAASLVAALIVGVAVYAVVPPTQDSNATVLLVPSSVQPGVVGRTNPFYSLGGSTLVMTTVVEVLVTDDKTSTRLASQGYRAKYEVTPNLAVNAGPTLLVKVTDKSASMAQSTLAAVLREVAAQLRTVQTGQGVTPDLMITSVALTQSTHATADHKNQIQIGAIVTVAALFLLFTLILLWERRRPTTTPPSAAGPGRPNPLRQPDPNPPPPVGRLEGVDPPTGSSSLAGHRAGSRQARRTARVALTTRRRIGRPDRPSRSSR
jgi:hypothetical protein